MKIGVIGAMPQEVALLARDLAGARTERRGARDYLSGRLAGHEAVVVFSGWGKVASASTATTLIEVFGVDAVVFTGVAGALAADLAIGDVVIGDDLLQHDLDASAVPGIARYEVPLLGVSRFKADARLVELAQSAAGRYLAERLADDVGPDHLREFGLNSPAVRTGLIVSGDQFISSPDRVRDILADLPDALCVEMEGAAVAQVCFEHGKPCVVLRVISDKADHAAPVDFPRFLTTVASHLTCGVVMQLMAAL